MIFKMFLCYTNVAIQTLFPDINFKRSNRRYTHSFKPHRSQTRQKNFLFKNICCCNVLTFTQGLWDFFTWGFFPPAPLKIAVIL